MKIRVAIIGGGIAGATTAYYLSRVQNHRDLAVTMFDSGHGQATKAAAGIISPWLSKRRNQQWYHLARAGAALLPRLAKTTRMPRSVYDRSGTVVTRDSATKVNQLYQLANRRRVNAPAMGRILKLTANQVKAEIPILGHSLPGVMVIGGARVNGRRLVEWLVNLAKKRNLRMVKTKVRLVSDHRILVHGRQATFDWIVVATGAWLRQTLLPLGIKADVRPQKGQLIQLAVPDVPGRERMPVLMPEGEYDFLPFGHGRLVIGATHEDAQRFDLTPNQADNLKLLRTAQHLISGLSVNDIVQTRTGTRGFTGDYGPFFGAVPHHPKLLFGGGLGSSGLTTGPVVGKFLARMISTGKSLDWSRYEKPIQKYFRFN